MSGIKKLILVLLLIVAAGAFYYVSQDKSTLTNNAPSPAPTDKTIVLPKNTPSELLNATQKLLLSLEKYGFTLNTKQTGDKKTYNVLQIKDESKIIDFCKVHNIPLNQKELQNLKGLILALETEELADNNLSIIIYPLSLPSRIKEDLLRDNHQKIWEKIKALKDEKAFMIEVKTDYFHTHVDALIKDINTSLPKEQNFNLFLQDMHMNATIKEDRISSLITTLNTLDLTIADLKTYVSNFRKYYMPKDKNVEEIDYNISKLILHPNKYSNIEIENLNLSTISLPQESNLSTLIKGNIRHVEMVTEDGTNGLYDLKLAVEIENLNAQAFDSANRQMLKDKTAFYAMLDNIVSHDIRIHFSQFEAQDVTHRGKTTDGFTLKGSLVIDRTIPLRKIAVYPKKMAKYLHGRLDFYVSKELVKLIKRDPSVKMVLLLMQPKRRFGRRLFVFKFKNSELEVNKISVF